MRGFTEAFFRVQLVADGSASNRRAFGVAPAKVRRYDNEGSAFKYNRRNDLVESKDQLAFVEGSC